MEKSHQYQCPNCGLVLPQINKEFHKATCSESQRNNQSQSQSQMEVEDESVSNQKEYNFDNYPQVPDNYKKEKVDLHKLKKDSYSQKIICPKCTLPLEISQLENHDNECKYKPCRFCREYYPQEFVDNHEQQCYKRGIERQNSHSQNYSEQQSVDNDSVTNENNLLFNQGGREYVTRRITQRTPNGFFTTVQTVPVDQMNHQDPWLIMSRQLSNPGTNQNSSQRQSQQNNPFIHLEDQLQGQQNDTFFGNFNNLFHRNDNFFEDYTNHGRFMRMNRHLIDINVLTQLLEQLRNPQHGMNQNQVNQIPKTKFKKDPNTPKGEEEKCSICITEYDDGEEVRKLPCNHFFHPECVDTWLVQNSSCPICKKDLLQSQHQQITLYQ